MAFRVPVFTPAYLQRAQGGEAQAGAGLGRGIRGIIDRGEQKKLQAQLRFARDRAVEKEDLSLLQQLSPEEADAFREHARKDSEEARKAELHPLEMQKQQVANQKAQIDAQAAQRAEAEAAATSKAELILNAFAPAMQNAGDPTSYRRGRAEGLRMVQGAVQQGLLSPEEARNLAQASMSPQQLHDVWQANVQTLDSLQPTRLDPTTAAGRVAIDLGVPTAEMAARYFPEEVAQAQAELDTEKTSRARAGAPKNNITVGMQRKVEEDYYDAEATLGMVDDIESLGDPEQFLGWLNRADFWAKTQADQAGILNEITTPEDRAAFNKAATFRAVVDKYRSLEFKKLIGSAQTATEVENLANAILNAKMGPTQFRMALKQLRHHTERVRDTADAILQAGDVRVGSRAYKKRMEAGLRSAKQREIDEVEQQMAGQSPEDIARELQSRGLL